jgi:hypothetical protein
MISTSAKRGSCNSLTRRGSTTIVEFFNLYKNDEIVLEKTKMKEIMVITKLAPATVYKLYHDQKISGLGYKITEYINIT